MCDFLTMSNKLSVQYHCIINTVSLYSVQRSKDTLLFLKNFGTYLALSISLAYLEMSSLFVVQLWYNNFICWKIHILNTSTANSTVAKGIILQLLNRKDCFKVTLNLYTQLGKVNSLPYRFLRCRHLVSCTDFTFDQLLNLYLWHSWNVLPYCEKRQKMMKSTSIYNLPFRPYNCFRSLIS